MRNAILLAAWLAVAIGAGGIILLAAYAAMRLDHWQERRAEARRARKAATEQAPGE